MSVSGGKIALRSMIRIGSASRHSLKRQLFHSKSSSTSSSSSLLCVVSNVRGFSSLSTDLLKELRALSGAPIVDCKKALQNNDNNISAAMDWLREHGAAKASSKLQGRTTTEGLVGIHVSLDGKLASMVQISSETDFASRSSKFVELVTDISSAALSANAFGSLDSTLLSQCTFRDKTVKDLLDEAIVAIRENISVADAMKLSSTDGIFVGYVHNKVSSVDAGTSAAIVEIVPVQGHAVSFETMQSAGKKLAMHVVAARPLYLSPNEVPEDEIQKERSILMKQMGEIDQNKPAHIVEKIVDGKMRKFYESICLTEQLHMIEEKNPKVSNVLDKDHVMVKSFQYKTIG